MELNVSLLQLLAGFVALVVFLRWLEQPKAGSKLNLPPKPPSWPVIGHLHLFLGSSHLHREMHRLAEKYGPILHLRLPGRSVVLIASADTAREVLKDQDRNLASRPPFSAFNGMGFVEGSIAAAPYGLRWRYLRQVAITKLLSEKPMQKHAAMRELEMDAFVCAIFYDSARDVGFNLHDKIAGLFMNLTTRVLLGSRLFHLRHGSPHDCSHQEANDSEGLDLSRTLEDLQRAYGVPLVGDHNPRLAFLDWWSKRRIVKLHKKVDKFLNKHLDEHRKRKNVHEANAKQDFMDDLLSLPADEGSVPNTDNMIKGLILDLMGAGIDTSALTLEWTMAELIRNPHVMKRAHEELDSVVGRERRVQEADIPNLPFLQAIVHESLRLHPPAAHLLPHEAIDSCQIGGYDIPAKTTVLVSIWSISRAKSVWESPAEFKPERFLGRDFDVTGQNFDFIPFGSGRRRCPGYLMGLVHLQYAVATLLQSFDWQLPQGHNHQLMDMEETYGLAVRKTVPLHAVATPRLPPDLYC